MSDSPKRFRIDRNSPGYKLARELARADQQFLVRLVQKRVEQGLTQDDMAKRMGVSQPTVAAFERYDNDPKLSTIRRYAHALGVSIRHVVDGEAVTTWQPPKRSEQQTAPESHGPVQVIGKVVDRRTLREVTDLLAHPSTGHPVKLDLGYGVFKYVAEEEPRVFEPRVMVSAQWKQ